MPASEPSHPNDNLMERFDRAGLRRFRARDAIIAVAIAAVSAVTLLSGLYFRSQIGGVTGDCFGATNQLAEIAVYMCGVWA